jgi:hypothetical protein
VGGIGRTGSNVEELLGAQPDQPTTVEALQALIGRFVDEYNHRRPHRALRHHATPATAYQARSKATPGDRSADTHDRLRRDRIDDTGEITLRYQGQLSSIGIGRTHARTNVLVLVRDLDIRLINAATGELLRDPRPRPHAPLPGHRRTQRTNPQTTKLVNPRRVGSRVSDVLRHHTVGVAGFEPTTSSSRTSHWRRSARV